MFVTDNSSMATSSAHFVGAASGTWAEQLAEFAGRICYNSYGAAGARSSADYHAHILAVGHLSIYEHPHICIEIEDGLEILPILMNRPSMFVEIHGSAVRICCNVRHLLEFDRSFGAYPAAAASGPLTVALQQSMASILATVAPQLVVATGQQAAPAGQLAVVRPPWSEDSHYVTLRMDGSRCWSHEQVRHGDWTAISQRSTRYCDESESEIVLHPELVKLNDELAFRIERSIAHARDTYKSIVSSLTSSGCSRKVARGAARGLLPSALATSMVFTASVSEWRHMYSLRCAEASDGEIAEIFSKVPAALAEAGVTF